MTATTIVSNLLTAPLDVPSAIAQRRATKNFKPDAIAPDLLKRLVRVEPSPLLAVGTCKIGELY